MIRISDALYDLVTQNHYLRFGINKHILNLSQVAKLLRPLIEARTKKEVKESAILMHLSRLQRRIDKITPTEESTKLLQLSVRSDLCSMTFENTRNVFEKAQFVYASITSKRGFIALSQGQNEITMIIDQSSLTIVQQLISSRPKYTKKDLSAIQIQFEEKYSDIPGLIYHVIQCVTLQNINISEISSTYTNLIIFIEQKNTGLAFNTLYNTFIAKNEHLL